MLYVFFWVIPRRLNFICRRFGALCSIFIGRKVHLPAYEDGTEGSETSAITFRRRGITQKRTYNSFRTFPAIYLWLGLGSESPLLAGNVSCGVTDVYSRYSDLGLNTGRVKESFLFSKRSRPALGPTQPAFDGHQVSLPGVKRPEG